MLLVGQQNFWLWHYVFFGILAFNIFRGFGLRLTCLSFAFFLLLRRRGNGNSDWRIIVVFGQYVMDFFAQDNMGDKDCDLYGIVQSPVFKLLRWKPGDSIKHLFLDGVLHSLLCLIQPNFDWLLHVHLFVEKEQLFITWNHTQDHEVLLVMAIKRYACSLSNIILRKC